MVLLLSDIVEIVHCRVGSLEKIGRLIGITQNVHCRVGSLEINHTVPDARKVIHCRSDSQTIRPKGFNPKAEGLRQGCLPRF